MREVLMAIREMIHFGSEAVRTAYRVGYNDALDDLADVMRKNRKKVK